MNDSYYLGLNIGTGSVGWAVTNPSYELQRKHGKDLWGVRLFETASTAKDRGLHRRARRNNDRKNWRIQILQEMFAEEITKVDPGFYLRMKESKYYPEDKKDMNGDCPDLPYALFVDSNFTDKDYHTKFPTIYHLRKYLMETDEKPDIRLVYLAIHHMMKHRGHFLLSGDISQIQEFDATFLQFVQNLKNEELKWTIEPDSETLECIKNSLKDKKITKKKKGNALKKKLKSSEKCEEAVLDLLSGNQVELGNIFEDMDLTDDEKGTKLSFSDINYEKDQETIEAILGEQYYIIESAKAVYDWAVLAEILDENISISDAKIKIYEKHKEDLSFLKRIVRSYFPPELYSKIFTEADKKTANYPAYAGNGISKCTQENFCSFLAKVLDKNKILDPDDQAYFKEEVVDKKSLCPKQINTDNCVIPHQVHEYDLKTILKNMAEKIPFIKENAEKIIQLFEFKIPYYVGPLNYTDGKDEKFTWVVRRSAKKIYPWNFEDIVDLEASAEKFIRRMTNKCTYLHSEDVLPKDSLLYRKYMVLNELNRLCINGEHISVELKQGIYEDLFCKRRRVTIKALVDYLHRQGIDVEATDISGIDKEFKTKLTSYHDFKERLTGVSLSQKAKEEIVLNIVLFGDDKKLLKQRLQKMFPELTEKQLKSISSLSYKGWGTLSKTFLENITAHVPGCSGERNIITAMWETNHNLQQLLKKDYGFLGKIESFNFGETNADFTYETVDKLYVSPAVKRPIWQTLKIIKELQKIMGGSPERIFIDMGRGDSNSKSRTKSRKEHLQELYNSCIEEVRSDAWLSEVYGRLQAQDDAQLRSQKLYLYYTQKGKCMYSEEEIPFQELWVENGKYDIDHIYPQSKTMDDSLDNLVLVKKTINQTKDDNFPVSPKIQEARHAFWKKLLEKKFISKKKYDRLTRKSELTADELAGFIERQLVETRQSTKAVADILKQALPGTEIVYVKSGTVVRFRHDFRDYDCMLKVRDMNDLHNAKDAYLNIVVGNAYYVKFTKDAAWFVRKNPGRSYNLKKMFRSDTGQVPDIVRNGEVAWREGENGTIVTVAKVMKSNHMLITRMTYEVKGRLFKQLPLKKHKGNFPLKTSDGRLKNINKYGGYPEISGSYFVLVQSKDKRGNVKRTIEFVPVYLSEIVKQKENVLLNYLSENCKLIEPEILLKIKKDTLFKINGTLLWISGRRNDSTLLFKNANQLLLDYKISKLLNPVVKFVDRKKEKKELLITAADNITNDGLIMLYDSFCKKLEIPAYNFVFNNELQILNNGRELFLNISPEEKCIVLVKILHMLQCRSARESLKEIGGPSEAGRISKTKNVLQYSECFIITQSVTGFFEKKYDLKSGL